MICRVQSPFETARNALTKAELSSQRQMYEEPARNCQTTSEGQARRRGFYLGIISTTFTARRQHLVARIFTCYSRIIPIASIAGFRSLSCQTMLDTHYCLDAQNDTPTALSFHVYL
jgi:hypothetical protein